MPTARSFRTTTATTTAGCSRSVRAVSSCCSAVLAAVSRRFRCRSSNRLIFRGRAPSLTFKAVRHLPQRAVPVNTR